MALWAVKAIAITVGTIGGLYIGLVALLTTATFQSHVVYLHAIQMTWFKDLNTPEVFGFLHNQVTPFRITAQNGIDLYAWHILPVGLYQKHENQLLTEPSGFVSDFENRLPFQLLRDDPEARLVVHFHGAGGTVGSGYRCPNYRALSAGAPDKLHVLTFDYRGFGASPGVPSEKGLIADALAVVDWALHVARIPASRIVIYSQSLGTAVNMAVAEHYALQRTPVVFAGHILTAPFVDVTTLVSTYSVAGTIPLLGPVARFPVLLNYLKKFIRDQWSTKDRIANYVRTNEANNQAYRITLLHAEDDYDIPWTHTPTLFWHAANASGSSELTRVEVDEIKTKTKSDHKMAGTIVEWKTSNGIIREEILKYGLHDVIMGNPIVSLAVMRMFDGSRDGSMLEKDTQ
ncbi:alpha/beta-hydrolase [Dissoconium aciculare CBS 342.82]|uniref:Alpha/beta-hydrolase n=1 Tax=Dissoconium aciculare CBS 342.82 TaxID=1314786 RepID=A0A6J3LTE3_9PEZI|nr:alpha/beta-hydrolase [Dissoconium aciculare CBS 342.82]KAF1817887.1 alpha/beta-hydrolase [Dissoconium aciculare CBS 342.82]